MNKFSDHSQVGQNKHTKAYLNLLKCRPNSCECRTCLPADSNASTQLPTNCHSFRATPKAKGFETSLNLLDGFNVHHIDLKCYLSFETLKGG